MCIPHKTGKSICICNVEPNYGFYTTGRDSVDGGLYWCRFLRAVLYASKKFACSTPKGSENLSFMAVFKPHTHKLDILRHCTNIVYL